MTQPLVRGCLASGAMARGLLAAASASRRACLAVPVLLLPVVGACNGERVGLCGNGVAEASEECDGADLRQESCQTAGFSSGQVSCKADCTIDYSLCSPLCGNGIVEEDEECDCGTDPVALPSGCMATNGAPDGACTHDCVRVPVCGDGILDPGEECDDGNTEGGDGCDEDCRLECLHLMIHPCAPGVDLCCPDWHDAETTCSEWVLSRDNRCLRACDDTGDCYFSTTCNQNGACDHELCGPGFPSDTLDGPCEITGGGPGWCQPFPLRDNPFEHNLGYCVESGTHINDWPCNYEGGMADRSNTAVCEMGICAWWPSDLLGIGRCRQFCHWEDAYSDAIYGTNRQTLPCPPGWNCWPEDFIDDTGLRQRFWSLCQDIYDGPTCSLVTDQLLADPALTCADVFSDGRCSVQDLYGYPSIGQLIGRCEPGPAATPGLTPWDLCDPLIDICPPGSTCEAEDFFGERTGQARCLPYCDAAHHDGDMATCFDLGIDPSETGGATPVCTSLSMAYEPRDIEPTRLGYCALPGG